MDYLKKKLGLKKGGGKRTAGGDPDTSPPVAQEAAAPGAIATSPGAIATSPGPIVTSFSTRSGGGPSSVPGSHILSLSGTRAGNPLPTSLISPRDGVMARHAATQRQSLAGFKVPPLDLAAAQSARSETAVGAKSVSRPPSAIRAASPAALPLSPRPAGTSAVVSPAGALAILSPRTQSPALWPAYAGQMKKDSALNPAQAAILTLSIGPTLTLDALERFQSAGMKHFEQMGIMSIVDDERMPSRAMATRSLFFTALNDLATFHIDNCVRMEGESVDWADFLQIPIPFIGPVMLLKGDNPRLDALRNGIYRFRRIQHLVKTRVHEPGLSEEANRKISNDILREPMQELAAFAGYKYGMLLFVSPPGELWATGMCKPRYQELLKWLDAIESRVKKSIKAYDDRNVALAAVQAMIAPVDMAPDSDVQCNARTANHFIDVEMAA
jgi:hypothetical protein